MSDKSRRYWHGYAHESGATILRIQRPFVDGVVGIQAAIDNQSITALRADGMLRKLIARTWRDLRARVREAQRPWERAMRSGNADAKARMKWEKWSRNSQEAMRDK